jgi:two-component system nitrogen regulation sensor histidine kinase NtrY
MKGNPFQKGYPWLVAGFLLLAVSAALYIYDNSRSDRELLSQLESQVQRDFKRTIDFFTGLPFSTRINEIAPAPASQLIYSPGGRLIAWNNNSYLPLEKEIKYLKDVKPDKVISLDDYRTYYQIRENRHDTTAITLIPISITYKVNNDFLLPYYFLGQQMPYLTTNQKTRYLKNIKFDVGSGEGDIVIRDQEEDVIYSLSNLPTFPFRSLVRYAVLIFLVLGTASLAVFLRIYTLFHWKYRYFINVGAFIGVILIRALLLWVNLPGDYLQTELFSAEILASDTFFAPSLGEFTLNVFTVAILVWIIYTHLFRIINIPYQRVLRKPLMAWLLMIVGMAISGYLISLFFVGFARIIDDSQIDIEFSNLLQTNVYSFLILLDIGMLMLSVAMICFLLLKLNVLFGRRYGFSIWFIGAQILLSAGVNYGLYTFLELNPILSVLATLGLILLALIVYRVPFRPLLHQNLGNYMILVLVITIFSTYGVVNGVTFKNRLKADQIARRILGDEVTNTIVSLQFALSSLNDDMPQIQETRQRTADDSEFRDWIRTSYLEPNFQEFNVDLYLYDQNGTPLDKEGRRREPSFGPESDVRIEDQGLLVGEGIYQIPNRDNKYRDIYIGSFVLPIGVDTSQGVSFFYELTPATRETEGLYSSLSLDTRSYENIKLLNTFDHALYRDGVLYHEQGQKPFPLYLATRGSAERIGPDNTFFEIQYQISANKEAVVRYPVQSFLDVITTFSFIFYFFTISALLVLFLPIFAIRSLRSRKFRYQFPLRARIRFGLLGISILPMVIIIVLLYPFIQNRFEADARAELAEEAARLVSVLGPEYLNLNTDRFSKSALERNFRQRIRELEPIMKYDVNIFDREGRWLASTQPLTYEQGLTTDLMNAQAFQDLRYGERSDDILNEQIGSLEYLSGYRPIIGTEKEPLGFLNVPFIAQQGQLNAQVIDFLAYLANIYLLVFLLINMIAVLVAGTITQPLAVIQQRLSNIRLGNVNERIEYSSNDEIGAIVSAYNEMVEQLERSEKKITQNQRELAWRQMARQVAHEIKNPLTPMKLSIQHLSRAFKEKNHRFEGMFSKVMKTLLVQIDSMVHIANSFSEFARMPEPVNSLVKVNEILLEVVDLYTQSQEAIWLIDIPEEDFWAIADRDQLSRSFNNIIKNALQAVESNGILHVAMRTSKERAYIEIKDNGKGIPEEIQDKIFEPSFSTKNSGMGLGLAIVKRILENAGGNIHFISEEGKGTTFYIEIPAAKQDTDLVKDLEKASA